MIAITFQSATAYLIDDAPVWGDQTVEVRAEIPGHVETGATKRETRRPYGDTLRLSVSYAALIQDAALTTFRNNLQVLTTQRVLCPLWPHKIEAGGSPVITADFYALLGDGSAPEIKTHAQLPFSRPAYPMLVGRFETRPDPQLLTDTVAVVQIDFTENDQWFLTPPTFTPPNGLTAAGSMRPMFPFRPNWATRQDGAGAEQDVERRTIGHGRSTADHYETHPAYREAKQVFTLRDNEPWQLLRLMLTWGGTRDNFWTPHGLSDMTLTADITGLSTQATVDDVTRRGTNTEYLLDDLAVRHPIRVTGTSGSNILFSETTPAATLLKQFTRIESLVLSRLKSRYVTLRFSNGELANLQLEFVETPWERTTTSGETLGTTMGALPPCAYLFLFTQTFPDAKQVWAYTEFERDLTVAGFQTSDLFSPKVWLKADSIVGSDGDPIQTWTDVSGQGNDATQATSGKRPILKTGLANGSAVLRFDGTDDEMTFPIPASAAQTIFIVARKRSAATSSNAWLLGHSNNSIIYANSLGPVHPNSWIYSNAVVNSSMGGNCEEFTLLTLRFASTSVVDLYLNGSLFTGSVDPHDSVSTATIIAIAGNGGAYANVDIAEILYYDSALSAANREVVENYLRSKYILDYPYGRTYTKANLGLGNIRRTLGMERQQLKIDARHLSGSPLSKFVPMVLEWPLQLTVFEADVSSSNAVNLRRWFSGEVVSAKPNPPYIDAKGLSLPGVFDIRVPRRLLQPTDNWMLFEPNNGLLASDWEWTGTVDSFTPSTGALQVSSVARVVGGAVTLVAHFFAGGYLRFGTTTAAQYRVVADSTAASGGVLTLTIGSPFATNPSAGNTVFFYPGYDGQMTTNVAKFSNRANHGGFPFAPIGNALAVNVRQNVSSGTKK